ncbi:hypothetical protein N6H05_13215 [Sphingobium sp. WTD-1]|uniref:hypothetical protein n=1 Tax=Sphingobium sp. WTD-1 TaxID=2979467 RepID=UPI0024DE4A54|nr:hypothetical protein [Sphingobium sp. WTD-1]WIA54032.1 hypothetical protein N6H05_13215 [Sphingobium sp. WTD-1]
MVMIDPKEIVRGSSMSSVTVQVLTTVNAPYGADLSAHQLAKLLTDLESAVTFNAMAFSFFSEVPADIQQDFLKEMGVSAAAASKVACQFSELSGYALPLAA